MVTENLMDVVDRQGLTLDISILLYCYVCSVIDTQYDVICGKNKKSATSRLGEWSGILIREVDRMSNKVKEVWLS
jgi:hypothetical protein